MLEARRLALLATLAVVAVALGAPSAPAQMEPLLHNQAPRLIVEQEVHGGGATPCPAVTPSPAPKPGPMLTAGGCRAHFASTGGISFTFHLSAGGPEVGVSQCNVEFDMRVDGAGEGYLSHQEFFSNELCSKRACGQIPNGEARAWSFYLREVETTPSEVLTALLCWENLDGTGATHCELTLPLGQPSFHRYRFQATDATGHGIAMPHCEVSGTFDIEAVTGTSGEGMLEQNIEIRHG